MRLLRVAAVMLRYRVASLLLPFFLLAPAVHAALGAFTWTYAAGALALLAWSQAEAACEADKVSAKYPGLAGRTLKVGLDPTLPPVSGDTIRLEQVVVNLLSNAIDALRAIPPPRHLTVDTWVENAMVSVAVADNGRGVAPEIAARLFRPFATTKGRRGTGLGLYISKQIVDLHHGRIRAEFPSSGGTCFIIDLPLEPAG